jgi:two-component system NtrC family response regulator
VRELFNTLERAVAAAGPEPVLHPKHLPTEIRVRLARQSLSNSQNAANSPAPQDPPSTDSEAVDQLGQIHDAGDMPSWKGFKESALAEVGRQYLQRVMTLCDGDVTQAQEVTGLSRARLYALMKSFKLPRRRWIRRQ